MARPQPVARIRWFKTLRISVLLLILAVVSLSTWQSHYRSTRWREPLIVSIYPIAADDSPITRAYLNTLDEQQFKAIDVFFAREAERYRLRINEPFKTRLQPELKVLPPQRSAHAGIFSTVLWSLRLRYWAWNISRHRPEPEDIRVFVLFHDPAITPSVPHSLGLTQGLIGVVYAFAVPTMTAENAVVIAHELLHTVGATDKYDPANDAPRFPDGYADPGQNPLYPQKSAELMAGRRILAAQQWQQVASLNEVVIGRATAEEIHWPQHARP